MRTRTAPSERPRTPAISAVDISSTKRRTTARRRSPRRRPTAPRAARRLVATGHVGLEVERRRRRRRRPRAAPRVGDGAGGGARPRRCGRSGRARRGTWTRPRRRSGRARSSNRPGGQGGEERALGGVLGVVLVAELVDRVAVHLGEVLPIQGVEPCRVGLRRLHERAIAVEVGDVRGARPPPVGLLSSMPDGPSRYTRARGGGRPGGRARSRRRAPWRSPAGASGSSTSSAPVVGVDAGARPVQSVAVRAARCGRPGRSSAAVPPSRRRRTGRRGAPRSRPETGRGTSAASAIRSTGRPTADLAQRRHRPASSGGKSAAAPVRVDAEPDDARGSRVPRPSVSPSTPASLRAAVPPASTTRSFGHFRRIVPHRQPGDRLGRLGHRERGDRGQPPDALGRQPGRPEPERQQERGAGGRDPRAALAPATRPSARRRRPGRPPASRRPASRARRRSSSRRTAKRSRAGEERFIATCACRSAGRGDVDGLGSLELEGVVERAQRRLELVLGDRCR